MGSLPPFSSDVINPHSPPNTKTTTTTTTTTTQFSSASSCIDETTLLNLFKSQQSHLNFFFQHLDLPQTLAFTRTLLLQSSAGATIFFSGVGKSGFVAHKISQTLVSLGIRSGFLSPLDALHGDIGALSKTDVLVLFSKSGTTEELLRLVPCAKAKGAFLISVTYVDGNALASSLPSLHLKTVSATKGSKIRCRNRNSCDGGANLLHPHFTRTPPTRRGAHTHNRKTTTKKKTKAKIPKAFLLWSSPLCVFLTH